MKILLLLLATFAAQAAPSKSAPATIEAFYRKYLGTKKKEKLSLPFSEAFEKLRMREAAACHKFAKDEPCGLGADGDIYLDAQDYDSKLTYSSAGFKATEAKPGEVTVSFNLFPREKNDNSNRRTLKFVMLKEKSRWVVDDIVTRDESTRKQMQDQIDFLGKK